MPRPLALALLALLAVPSSALADTGVGPLEPAGAGAEGVSDLYWFIMVFAAIVFLAVTVPLTLFIVRYRSRGRPRDADGPQVHGSTQLELAWTAAPVVILAIIAGFTFYKLPGITDPATAGQPTDELVVEGRQFYWQYVYPNGTIAVQRLRLPAGRVTKLVLEAPDGDVIHSFWVPALAGKRDVIPGSRTSFKVLPNEPGIHKIVCGEFCGLQHAQMVGDVEVLSADEFDSWLEEEAQRQRAGDSDLGEQTFDGACATCHGLEAEGLVGPALAGNPLVTQRDAVEAVVRNGRNQMPAVGDGWSDTQMDALLDYLEQEYAPEGQEDDGGQG